MDTKKRFKKLLFGRKEFLNYEDIASVVMAMDRYNTQEAIRYARINRKILKV